MAPNRPVTRPKKVAAKGKGVSHPATQPQAHKVTCITSPTPEVAKIEVPLLQTAIPSQVSCTPLFKEPARLGDEDIGMGAPVKNGFSDLNKSQIGRDQ